MKKLTYTLLALAMATSGWCADPPDKKEVPLPVPVLKAEENMRSAVAKAQTEYLKKVGAEVKKLQAVLEAEKVKATKAGLLEVALAVKAKQEGLTVAEVAKIEDVAGDLLGSGGPDISKAIVGKWKKINAGEKFTFGTNKTATIMSAAGVVMSKGSWSYENGKFVVLWEKYGKEIVVYTQDNKQIASESYGWTGSMDE